MSEREQSSHDDAGVQLAVIVPCTRPNRVGEIVAALAASPRASELALWVVGAAGDSGISDPGSLPFRLHWVVCGATHPNVRRMLAIRQTRAPRVAFLSDDVVPDAGWVEAALSLSADEAVAATGPETPYRASAAARLAFRMTRELVLDSIWPTREHFVREIHWSDLPFSNCVLTRAVFEEAGLPTPDVPGPLAETEFCLRASEFTRFVRLPGLAVRHDRYPDRLREFLGQSFCRARNDGTFFVRFPELNLRMPTRVATALLPAVLTAGLVAADRLFPLVLASGFALYLAMLGWYARKVHERFNVGSLAQTSVLLLVLHVTQLLAFQLGIARGVAQLVWVVCGGEDRFLTQFGTLGAGAGAGTVAGVGAGSGAGGVSKNHHDPPQVSKAGEG